MSGELGHEKSTSRKVAEAIGWDNLGNVDWHDPFEAAATLLWLFLTFTAIIWVPVTLFTGAWVLTALVGFIWLELQPPNRPYKEMDKDLPASTLARTPEAIYRDQLEDARLREAEIARGDHLW